MKGESEILEGELFAKILYGCSNLGGKKFNPSAVSFFPNSVSMAAGYNTNVTLEEVSFSYRFYFLYIKTNKQRKCNCFQTSLINRLFSEFMFLRAAS